MCASAPSQLNGSACRLNGDSFILPFWSEVVPNVRINQYQAEIQPNYFQGSLKGLTGGKSRRFSPLPFIWSFTIPFKNLEACWEEHPVSSYLLPSSRWKKSDTVFSEWMCLSGWPLLYFYSTTSSGKISVYIKRPSTNACIFICIDLLVSLLSVSDTL